MMSYVFWYRFGKIENTTLLIGVPGMRNVYHFVYRPCACLRKYEQFQKLENISNKKLVPERGIEPRTY